MDKIIYPLMIVTLVGSAFAFQYWKYSECKTMGGSTMYCIFIK